MLKRGEIKSLTGLRGVAACAVVLYHYQGSDAGLGRFVLHGYTAVDLFFALSGFVMALTYAGAFADGFSPATFAGFLHKRLGRIYPLYIVVTLAVAELDYAGIIKEVAPSAWTIISNIFLVQSWGLADSIGGPTWSISTEFAAYLVFPLLVAGILTSRPAWTWAAAAAAIAILALVATRSPVELHQVHGGTTYRNGPLDVFGYGTAYPLLRCLAGFVLGMVAFRIAQLPAMQLLASRPMAGNLAAIVVVALLATRGSDVILVVAFVPLIIALAAGNSLAGRFLESRVIYWLGLVSYSVYLLHRLVGDLLRQPVMNGLNALHTPHAFFVSGVALFGLVFILSAASYYCIEKPARDWARKLMWRQPRPISSEPAAP
jgi:peptidoglycan/LPS O-acetylase OafA/YrhL